MTCCCSPSTGRASSPTGCTRRPSRPTTGSTTPSSTPSRSTSVPRSRWSPPRRATTRRPRTRCSTGRVGRTGPARCSTSVSSPARRPAATSSRSPRATPSRSRGRLFERLGGYDERYTSPGGGLCNLEMFARYALRPAARNVCLLSEGSFHQVHGGIATSGRSTWDDFGAEHRRIFGVDWERPIYESLYSGRIRVGVAAVRGRRGRRRADRTSDLIRRPDPCRPA